MKQLRGALLINARALSIFCECLCSVSALSGRVWRWWCHAHLHLQVGLLVEHSHLSTSVPEKEWDVSEITGIECFYNSWSGAYLCLYNHIDSLRSQEQCHPLRPLHTVGLALVLVEGRAVVWSQTFWTQFKPWTTLQVQVGLKEGRIYIDSL